MTSILTGVEGRQEEQETERKQRANVTIVHTHDAFDWLTLGEGMAILNQNRTVQKAETRLELSSEGGRRPMGEFAIWGAPAAVPSCSKWGIRIDKMQGGGDMWLGLLVTFRPVIARLTASSLKHG